MTDIPRNDVNRRNRVGNGRNTPLFRAGVEVEGDLSAEIAFVIVNIWKRVGSWPFAQRSEERSHKRIRQDNYTIIEDPLGLPLKIPLTPRFARAFGIPSPFISINCKDPWGGSALITGRLQAEDQ